MSKITIIYDDDFSVTTYEKELTGEGIEDIFEAYLEANQQFTFVNAVTVAIHNPIFEPTIIEWDSDNGLYTRDCYAFKNPEDVDEEYRNLYDWMKGSQKENWYMGYKF